MFQSVDYIGKHFVRKVFNELILQKILYTEIHVFWRRLRRPQSFEIIKFADFKSILFFGSHICQIYISKLFDIPKSTAATFANKRIDS